MIRLNTTREEATKHLGVLNQYANGGTAGEYPFAARVIQDRLDLEDELLETQATLASVREKLEQAVYVAALKIKAAEDESDKLRERLEAAERSDIWVAFTSDGMPREVTRQNFEPHINPRVGRWVRCVRVDQLGGRNDK